MPVELDTPMRTATKSNGGRSNGPTNVNFGRLVAVRRSALGLRQERLAARMHRDPPRSHASRKVTRQATR